MDGSRVVNGDERLAKRIFEVRNTGKVNRGQPTRKLIEEVKIAIEAREMKWEESRTIVKYIGIGERQ